MGWIGRVSMFGTGFRLLTVLSLVVSGSTSASASEEAPQCLRTPPAPIVFKTPAMPSWMVAWSAATSSGSTGRVPAADGGLWSMDDFANPNGRVALANNCPHCSNITVKCIPDAQATAKCNGVLACGSDCGMFIGQSLCDATRMQTGPIKNADFDQATNCLSSYAAHPSPDLMLNCCTLAHEKYHACNPSIKPSQCSEAPADNQGISCETSVVVANCRPGSKDPNCYSMCYQLASYVLTQGYDSCMCGVTTAANGHPAADQCCSCQNACTTAGLSGKMPPGCQQWLGYLAPTLLNNCKSLATTGSHDCKYYGGPTVPPGSCHPVVPCVSPGVPDPLKPTMCKCPVGIDVNPGEICPTCTSPAVPDPAKPGSCKCPDGASVGPGQSCPASCVPSPATRIPGSGYGGSCGQQQCNPTSCLVHTRSGTSYSQLGSCPNSGSLPNCVN